MKPTLFCTYLILWFINFGKAQDTTIVLNSSMFDQIFQEISMMDQNGWVFKEGSDNTWASRELNTQDWLKFNPTELSVKNADKSGRVEGWFRLKFRLDSSFYGIPLYINSVRFVASDIFIDGQHIVSFGTSGLDGRPYEEYRGSYQGEKVNLELNTDHILVAHIVEYRSPLNPYYLKTQVNRDTKNFGSIISLCGPDNTKNHWDNAVKWATYFVFWTSVCGVLSLLCWLLYFQNRSEKNLVFIALCMAFFAASVFSYRLYNFLDLSSISFQFFYYLSILFGNLGSTFTIIILALIFKRKINFLLITYCAFIVIAGIIDNYFFDGRITILLWIPTLCICIYFIISSWRRLQGAQWAVVLGVLSFMIFGIFMGYNLVKFGTFGYPYTFLHSTGVAISIPLSLMVYVAMRFKEILNEVSTKADEVVRITEEKRELLADQNVLLEKKVEERTYELKASQAQLIQSEKMASLGELTAGIAHEIQNPLNFVNNFSEINSELIDELTEEVENGDYEEVKSIAQDIKENEQKITHHGKRADAIVKGMLQHSRTSTGIKEPTDINALCDEYLRLSYHGLRAKDKSFNADFKTDFDAKLPLVNVIAQDIGRVLLNLINNAFYAVNEKSKTIKDVYAPKVTIVTQLINNTVEIIVIDNGLGIPSDIKEKIIQPFFTTKPTGQGTGLGLSLSYDIVKAHGGELLIESVVGNGSKFMIKLPLNKS